ncbi:hypothetical protein [Bacillus atrophaeus]|uniref:hypothetical protein n=1 Tax=Bacillus atrophaeus TaxID=1452 RepID=UPI001C633385|nr:hypothetical protein [Bacillus atrophaeus]MCY9107236.1 hypothetical protein [Bacillus atrophaeus]MED4805632.1 hypothetical protein [Bacillus atrophaeus]MED4818136.1 hypothetical protein [Bacillus atrophaeus]MED4823387.1 hypothetical protein [Bacillus atrophaeus]MED4845707.1 hypothetical protein [Bacillus atrophaeus]
MFSIYNSLFSKEELSHYLRIAKETIKRNINNEDENYILNIGEEGFLSYLLNEYQIDYISIKEHEAHSEIIVEEVSAEYFPNHLYGVNPGRTYKQNVVYFYLPIEGRSELFFCRPSTFTSVFPRAALRGENIIFKEIQFNQTAEEINEEYISFVHLLKTYINFTNKDLEEFNKTLEGFIRDVFLTRKRDILKRKEMEAALIVPVRIKESVSQTFSIPTPKMKKKINVKPSLKPNDQNFEPTPTLANDTYTSILRIINDMGKEFERKPSVYANKGEEDLRDHFLMLLEPHFEGSATGETFNKKGKTDILLRHNGNNAFVGECKFWKGEKSFLKTIDQLLGYLTWRDSKTAVIMFVRNKDFSSVLKIAQSAISKHTNFVRFNNREDDTWLNYTFHLNGDKNKELQLALMMYHTE